MGLIRIDSTHLGLGGDSVALGSIHCESRWGPGESLGVVGSPWESAGVRRID